MVHFETEERARLKRLKIEQAVNLAMQSRWQEAAELNGQLIDSYPKEVEAYNRLGKALLELGRFDDAREAYNHALRLEPMNTIAQKNIARLETLREEDAPMVAPSGPVDPSLFIAETGRSTTTSLVELGPADVLATVDAGDTVTLEYVENTVLVKAPSGEVLGKIEPRLRQRLIRLTGMGNEYSAVVTGVDEQSLRVIVRETHRDPSMGERPSFPTSGDGFRGYTRDSLLRYDLEDEEVDDDEELEADGHERERDQDTDLDSDSDADIVPEQIITAEEAAMGDDDDEDN
jgi:hypothetical protein